MFPFRNKRPKPKRKEPRRVGNGRVRLYGKNKTHLRHEVFERSGGRCEEMEDGKRCENEIFWKTFHLSHKKHSSKKTDTLEGCIASCPECHVKRHNCGGKPIPRRPGRVMTKKEAVEYLNALSCFCRADKAQQKPFCESCWMKLSPQLRMDLERLTNRDWLRAMSDAEMELLNHALSEK